jgi:uncharacterized membrane protein YphA (DoxX/SURF4 family)
MKLRTVYWIVTGFFCLMITFGAVFNVVSAPPAIDLIVTKLGYPAYVVPFLGVAKIIGCIVVLIPGNPRLKEWAYAGIAFDLIGALYSHISVGAAISEMAGILLPLTLLAASYVLNHKTTKAT